MKDFLQALTYPLKVFNKLTFNALGLSFRGE